MTQNPGFPQIENVEIIELLGQGGMSVVYKAKQQDLDRIVAVKMLSSLRSNVSLKRFQAEAKLTSALDHPNIVKIVSFGVSKAGQPYLVMEYLKGLSLSEELKQHGRLQLQRFRDFFLPLLSALDQAHQLGLVHRDIKPGNIMICRDDSGKETVKLVDFGIAKVVDEGSTESLTGTGDVLGSPAYMSPEQCLGKPLDGRSDLYSLACVMYETLSGEPPFSAGSALELMQKHSAEPPPTVSELSRKIDVKRELANVTVWALAKNPSDRPQSAQEFAQKLREVLDRITLDKVPSLRKQALSSGQIAKRAALLVAFVLLAASVFITANKIAQKVQKADVAKASLVAATNIENREGLRRAKFLEGEAFESFQKEDYYKSIILSSIAIKLREKFEGQNAFSLATPLAYCANSHLKLGESTEAKALFNRAVQILRRNEIRYNKELAELFDMQKNSAVNKAEYLQVIERLRRAIAECRETGNSAELPTHLTALSTFCLYKGLYKEATRATRESLDIEDRLNKRSHNYAQNLVNLGALYVELHEYADAETVLKQALAIFEKHPNTLEQCHALNYLALSDIYRSKPKEAEKVLRETLEIEKQALDPGSLFSIESLEIFSDACCAQQKFAEAQTAAEKALSFRLKSLKSAPDDDSRRSPCTGNYCRIAACLYGQSKPKDAIEALNKALKVGRQTLDDRFLSSIYGQMASYYAALGDMSKSAIFSGKSKAKLAAAELADRKKH